MQNNMPNQFMNWTDFNPLTGEKGKFPCLTTGKIVDPHDPNNWTTYDNAAQCGNVAFVITENDPYFFLDLDKCRDDQGNWSAAAQSIYLSFAGAMGEISTSGKGLHILGKCNKHMLQDRRNKWDGWLEFYTTGRFIAFGNTGWQPINDVNNPDVDWTQQLLHFVPQRQELGEITEGVDPAYTGPSDDDELVAKMLASVGGAGQAFGGKATVAQLWNADPILCQIYPDYQDRPDHFDHSSADAALFAHLAFWTGKDMPRMDRLFRKSALMRDKYDKREDYRTKTVYDAARMCNRVYDFEKKDKKPKALPAPEVYLTVNEQIAHFEGCVYIRDLHRVMVPDGTLLKPEQFKSTYGGHIFQMNPDGTQPEKNAFIAFTENRTHRFPKVNTAIFNPNLPSGFVNDNEVNIYVPAVIDSRPGDITRFTAFLTKLMPEQSDREIILAWMAACVQNPGSKFQWAPVLQGTEGNGKTFLMNCVAQAIGERHTHRPNAKELGEKYNSYVETSLFIIVEEIHMQGRREMLDDLKDKITNEWLEIRGMAQDKRMARNFSKWGFCTNHMDAVLKSQNDRRYAIFFLAQQCYADIVRDGMNGDYFPDLYNWARKEGYAAVTHFLMNYAIPEHLNPATLCHRAPNTTSTAKAITKSIGMIEGEIIEAANDGTIGFKGGFVSSLMLDKLMRDKGFRVGRNKRVDIMIELGYSKCTAWVDGRFPKAIVEEGSKRPVIYVKNDLTLENDVVKQYYEAQGYMSQGFGMPSG